MPGLTGHLEPGVGGGKEAQDVEEHGAGSAGAGKAWHALALRITHPHANGVFGRHANRPRIAEAVAGACLPGRLPHRADEPPVQLVGPIHLFQGIQGVPDGQRWPVEAGHDGLLGAGYDGSRHSGVGGCDFVQSALSATQDEREAVVFGVLGEGGEAHILQERVELGHAVLTKQEHGRHVEGTGQGLGCRHGTIKLPVKVLRGKTAQVHGNVRKQGVGQDIAFLQRCSV